MTSPLNIEQEADALEALRIRADPRELDGLAVVMALGTTTDRRADGTVEPWRIERFKPLADYLTALHNRAMPLIRALRKRITQRNITLRETETNLGVSEQARDSLENQLARAQARIESLEAERDIWRERAGTLWYELRLAVDSTNVEELPDPTPAEIAARVEQNRKERAP